jgi:RNA polymerase sigma-70 factor (ECF subfamily)
MDDSSTSSETRRFIRDPTDLAWADFVERYAPRLLMWGHRQGLDHQACEDVTQDVLIRLHKYVHSYDREKSFRGWLFKVTENAALDYIKSQKKADKPLPDGFEDSAIGPGGIAEYVANQDIVIVVRERAKMQVSEKEWTAYELHDMKHRTYSEITEELKISEATAMNYVSKVRKVLAEELRKLEEG